MGWKVNGKNSNVRPRNRDKINEAKIYFDRRKTPLNREPFSIPAISRERIKRPQVEVVRANFTNVPANDVHRVAG